MSKSPRPAVYRLNCSTQPPFGVTSLARLAIIPANTPGCWRQHFGHSFVSCFFAETYLRIFRYPCLPFVNAERLPCLLFLHHKKPIGCSRRRINRQILAVVIMRFYCCSLGSGCERVRLSLSNW